MHLSKYSIGVSSLTKQKLLKSLRSKRFDESIVEAFEKVKREDFVPDDYKYLAYRDRPLPIGENSTISQPYTIAFMLNLLEVKDSGSILEIGSGCGYVLALLSVMAPNAKIYGLEINKELVNSSKERFNDKENVEIIYKDGAGAYSEKAPFDCILASAAFSTEPSHLFEQLKDGGVLVVPVRNSIIKYKKVGDEVVREDYFGFSFVPIQ